MTRAMLTAHRGDPEAALAALADLESRRGHTWDVVQMHTWFLRAKAHCLLLAGDASGAADEASASLTLDGAGSNAPTSLWVAVQAGSVRHDATSIRAALEATAGLRGQWTGLIRGTALASIACLDAAGEVATDDDASIAGAAAAATMAAALDAWNAADLPLDHAYATLCAMHVLPPSDVLESHVDRARAYLTALDAVSLLRRYDALRQP